MTNATTNFLGPEVEWERAEIRLDDVHGLWGGQALTVTDLGRVTLQRIAPAFPAGQWEATLPASETCALFQQFIEHDFVALTLPEHTPIPDEAHPQITLTNAQGETHTVLKWARQKDRRFEALYVALRALAEGTTR